MSGVYEAKGIDRYTETDETTQTAVRGKYADGSERVLSHPGHQPMSSEALVSMLYNSAGIPKPELIEVIEIPTREIQLVDIANEA